MSEQKFKEAGFRQHVYNHSPKAQLFEVNEYRAELPSAC